MARPKKKPSAKKLTPLERERLKRRQAITEGFAARHPARAREERELRKRNRADLRDWSHKANGTPETHAKASRTQQGALARLFMSGAIDSGQLASAGQIAWVAEKIGAELRLRTVSLETRVDSCPRHDGAFFERLGAVRAEVAYSAWRKELPAPGPVLAMIIEDCGLTEAARRYRMGKARAKKLLLDALDRWDSEIGTACKEVSAADLAAWHAGLM